MENTCVIEWIDCPELKHLEPTKAITNVRCIYTKLSKEAEITYSELLPICQAHLDYMNKSLLKQSVSRLGTLASRWEVISSEKYDKEALRVI